MAVHLSDDGVHLVYCSAQMMAVHLVHCLAQMMAVHLVHCLAQMMVVHLVHCLAPVITELNKEACSPKGSLNSDTWLR